MDDHDAQTVIEQLKRAAPELVWDYRLDSIVPGMKSGMLWLIFSYEIEGQEYGHKLMVRATDAWTSPRPAVIQALAQKAREYKERRVAFLNRIHKATPWGAECE